MISLLAKAVHYTEEYGDFNICIFQHADGQEHVVLTCGAIEHAEHLLCRVASECLPGMVFLSAECDCQEQLEKSMQMISEAKEGIIIFLRQEGRGHGLVTKIQALANKNIGFDTFTAVEELGLQADVRDYSVVKDILDYFKIKSIACICSNPDKVQSLQGEGILIETIIDIPVSANSVSRRHLEAKQKRGHTIKF